MRIPSPVKAILPLILLFAVPAEAHPHGYMQRLQNDLADKYHLPRFKDLAQLRASIKAGKLARVHDTDSYRLDPTFGEKDPDHRDIYAHVQPWTKAFLDREIGAAHDKFGTQYVITSLVRTQKYQNMLCHGNANAICGGYGWKRSAHLTGATVDIGRVGLSEQEQAWIERRLNALWRQGKLVYIAEGGQQYCFHVMVLPSYDDEDKVADNKRHAPKKRTRHRTPAHHPKHAHKRHKAHH